MGKASPLEWRAAQSRWAHPRKAPEPSSGSGKAALWPCCAASPTDLPSSLMPLTPLRSGGLTWSVSQVHTPPRSVHVARTACDPLGPSYLLTDLLTCLLTNVLTFGATCGDGGGGGGADGVGVGVEAEAEEAAEEAVMKAVRVLED